MTPTTIQTIAPSPRLMQTGVPGLDEVLRGGLLPQHSLLLQGSPGSGRTALGLQIIATGARQFDEPGVVLSFERFPKLFYTEAQGLGWDLRTLEAEGKLRVVFARTDDLHSPFAERESEAVARVTEAASEINARRVLVDSAAEFSRLPLQPEEQRKLLADFILKLKELDVTPILTGDAPRDSSDFGSEESAVDSIVRLSHAPAAFAGGQRQRFLEVIKSRGQRVLEGRHPFRLGAGGLHVFPYVPVGTTHHEGEEETDPNATPIHDMQLSPIMGTGDALSSGKFTALGQRASTGIRDLDELVHGGVLRGSSTMLVGMSGSGKTTLALHFIADGLAKGERGVYVTLNERRTLLKHNAARRGLDLAGAEEQGRLTMIYGTAPALQPLELLYRLRDALGTGKGHVRVVIDGLRQFLSSTSSEPERDYLMALLADMLVHHNATTYLTYRIEEVAGLSSVAATPYTGQMDNLLYLGLVELHSRLHRVLCILKTRGEASDSALRELVIEANRVNVTSLFAGLTGILLGSASGGSSRGVALPGSAREILEPLLRIRDFLHAASVETPEQAKQVMSGLRSEFDVLSRKLAERLGSDSPSAVGAGDPK